jgi:hypothetical protein
MFLIIFCQLLDAQVKQRWQMQFKHDTPEIYVYRDPAGKVTPCLYFTFQITNDTKRPIPIVLDITLKVDVGKELLADPEKIEPVKKKFRRYYTSIICPDVEEEIIKKHSGIAGKSTPVIVKLIEEFKKNNKYLNLRELRMKIFIQPGESLHAIAIFKGIDPASRLIDLFVSGLVDVVKMQPTKQEDKVKLTPVYENKVLKISYELVGDMLAGQVPIVKFIKKQWLVRDIGPIGSKQTVDKIVNVLTDCLDKKKAKKKVEFEIFDFDIMMGIIERMFDTNFGYKFGKDIIENEKAVLRLYYWWTKNRARVYYNEKVNKFLIKKK